MIPHKWLFFGRKCKARPLLSPYAMGHENTVFRSADAAYPIKSIPYLCPHAGNITSRGHDAPFAYS